MGGLIGEEGGTEGVESAGRGGYQFGFHGNWEAN